MICNQCKEYENCRRKERFKKVRNDMLKAYNKNAYAGLEFKLKCHFYKKKGSD